MSFPAPLISFTTAALVFLYISAAFFALAGVICSSPSQERKGLSRFCASHSAFLGFVIQRSRPSFLRFLYSFLTSFAASSGRLSIHNIYSFCSSSGFGTSSAVKPNRSMVVSTSKLLSSDILAKLVSLPGFPQSLSSLSFGYSLKISAISSSFIFPIYSFSSPSKP